MAMAEEVAISLVIRNSLLVLSEEKILSHGLRDQITVATNDLQNKFITSKLLESGTENDRQSSYESHLLGQARDAVHIADKVLLEASQHLKSHKGRLAKIRALVHSMSLWIRVRATKKMARDFIARVEELSNRLPQKDGQFHRYETGPSRNAHRGNICWNVKIESDFVGREDEVDELLAGLTWKDVDQGASRLRIISVVGEAAIGKTALVRSVYNRPDIDYSFHCRIWIPVPEEFILRDLLVEILKQTPLGELKNLEHMEKENLENILYRSLMELRYLIVFDNLCKAEDMDELMIILADSRSGSRVIVTTRDPEIPSIIDPWASPLKLKKLGADQGKRLLGDCVSVEVDANLTQGILRKCSGSPLGISLLGGLVADSALAVVDQLADNSTLLDIVSLSYRKLPFLLKPCLLYLCLFPKDSEISTRRLFRLWLAEGLLQPLEHAPAPGGEEQVPRSPAMKCFEELVGRNLVHVVRRRKLSEEPKSCRVPSFLHDFLCKIATQLGLLQIHSDTKGTNHSEESKVVNGCSWIVKSEYKNYHQESQQNAETGNHQHGHIQLQHLRSYVSFDKQKWAPCSREVEELLRPLIAKGDCGLLTVLDLEGIYKPKLPDGLGNVLLNLRYLGLRRTVLDSIPESVRNMSRLETLDLKHTNVGNLPSSIWKVKSLQHLYMNEVCFSKYINSEQYPSNLQILWGLYIEAASSPMLDLLRKLTTIQKLGLTCDSPVINKVTECLSDLPILQSLKLRSRDLFGQPSDLNLSDMTRLHSISDLYLLGSFPKRDSRILGQDSEDERDSLGQDSEDERDSLGQDSEDEQDILGRDGRDNLERDHHDNLERDREDNLERRELKPLPPNLKIFTLSMSRLNVDPMPVLGGFQSLEMLNLFADSYTLPELNFGANSFPSLRVLKLWKLKEVKTAHVDKTALRCLEELEIKECVLLTSIDSLNHIKSLKHISLIKVQEKSAKYIKEGLTQKLFINGKQWETSPSGEVNIKGKQLETSLSSRKVFIKEKQLVTSSSSSSSSAQATRDN